MASQSMEKKEGGALATVDESGLALDDDAPLDEPTAEELETLPRVAGKIHWLILTVAFCELCERFSYYGTSVLYTNFIQQPLPPGSPTGAGFANGQSGALGMGQRASTGLGMFNQFFAYVTPLFGAYMADARLGRFKAIMIAIAVSFLGHIILFVAALPQIIARGGNLSFGVLILGMVTMCCGTGFFKANIAPLIIEQNRETRMRVVRDRSSGARVAILDPAVTNSRILHRFYMCINVGSVLGQISMVYVEKYVGFWLAFLLPTVLFSLCPLVLFFCRRRYVLQPPTGSVLSTFCRAFGRAAGRPGTWLHWRRFSWEAAKPSRAAPPRPAWMVYDDAWVEELRRACRACRVFLFLPVFFLAYNQMTTNLTSQAAAMELRGVPNDVVQNLNPISIVLMVPVFDKLVYPALRRTRPGRRLTTPIARMCLGFFLAALSMVAAALIQRQIYARSPCGPHAAGCARGSGVNVWWQTLPYVLIGWSEIFTNITSLEYAMSKAPANMRSCVMAFNLFMSAFSSALGEAFTPISEDPYLVVNYATIAAISFLGGVVFWLLFRKLDKEEDRLNTIEKSAFVGDNVSVPAVAAQAAVAQPASR